ncbi:MAG: hypothetical protein IKN43_01015 [Selenomonadaceae bacterium]|nr:hypothetical protein [Selenomonadaceae bacterium]
MNTKDLSMRYKKSPQEIENLLQENIGELKDFIHYERKMWIVNPDSLHKLDKLFGYAGEAKDKKKLENRSQIPKESKKEMLVEKFENEVSDERLLELQKELQEEKERANKYADELARLQDKFIELQNGQEAMNSSFIKKQQIRAEAAEHELEKIRQRSKDDAKYKDGQIKSLQDRIKEMQDKLIESHSQNNEKQNEINRLSRQIEEVKEDSAKRCSKAELKVIESKRSEEKLYADLHETEMKLQEMSHQVNIANEERSEALRNMSAMRSEFIGVKSKLIEITAGLSSYLTDVEVIADSRIIKDENQIETEQTNDVKLVEEPKAVSDLSKLPANLSLAEPGRIKTLWQKVASFF